MPPDETAGITVVSGVGIGRSVDMPPPWLQAVITSNAPVKKRARQAGSPFTAVTCVISSLQHMGCKDYMGCKGCMLSQRKDCMGCKDYMLLQRKGCTDYMGCKDYMLLQRKDYMGCMHSPHKDYKGCKDFLRLLQHTG